MYRLVTVRARQVDAKIEAALPEPVQKAQFTGRVRETAHAFAPFRLASAAWADAKALLKRSARWVLPVFFAAWGAALQR
eukprot:2335568-Prymnesium_polylepis.1